MSRTQLTRCDECVREFGEVPKSSSPTKATTCTLSHGDAPPTLATSFSSPAWFHHAYYEAARVKDPPLPPLDFPG